MPTSNPDIPNIPDTDLTTPLAAGPAQPAVLFPVRLETRFFPLATGGFELRVRIYPDQVHIDSHEPGLTGEELAWGRHFWEQTWRASTDSERAKAAWRQLADRFDPPRAAWIAQVLKPLNPPTERPNTPVDPEAPLAIPIEFPSPPAKAASWTQPPVTRVLPNRWIVLGYRGGQLALNAQGALIPDILPTGPDPSKSAHVDELGIDDGMRWMVDFAAAEAAGMAVRARLTVDQALGGVDFLLALGIRDSADGEQRLANLFAAHHYTGGLSFVAQGTPTNNTQDAPSGYTSEDPGHEQSYLAERAALEAAPEASPVAGSNAQVLAEALGLARSTQVFANLPGAAAVESLASGDMNAALWQPTWGYFLQQILWADPAAASPLSDTDLAWVRSHFIDFVRASGPLPAVRVGKQPYGILPVTSLDAWKPPPGQNGQALPGAAQEAALHDLLVRLRELWRRHVADAPRLGRSDATSPGIGIDKDISEVMSMGGLSSSYAIRHVMGRQYLEHLMVFLGADFFADAWPPAPNEPIQRRNLRLQKTQAIAAWFAREEQLATAALRAVGITQQSRLGRALFGPRVAALDGALVQAGQGPSLAPDYAAALLAASDIEAIRNQTVLQPPPAALLYLLLRHALLLEYTGAASQVLVNRGMLQPLHRRERELVGFAMDGADVDLQPIIRRLETEITAPGQTGTVVLSKYLLDVKPAGDGITPPEPDLVPLSEFKASVERLGKLPVRQLEQLLSGTLDLASHRLDAWITSLASKRLHDIRRDGTPGVLLGGYGWVMNLKALLPAAPPAPPPLPPSEQGPLVQPANNPGFIHAPSLTQAATAALLRSGHLAHIANGSGASPLAIDLSSERVRIADSLLDGVRQGQPLAALLGYRFERGLHEHGLDEFIDAFRRVAPFGELQKALDACDDAEAEADRVEALPHPDLPAAQAALAAAQQQKAQLLAQQSQLTGQVALSDQRAAALEPQVAKAQDDVESLQDIVSTPGDFTPSQLAKLRAQLAAARQKLNQLTTQLNVAVASSQQAHSQLAAVNAQIPGADLAIQQAQVRVNSLSGPGKNPAFPAAKQAAEDAAAQYQQLLDQYRQEFLLPRAADQSALESVAAINVVDGLRLLKLRDEQAIPFGKKGLPTQGSAEQVQLSAELDALAATVDAVSDALLAETVYQAVRGNPLRAASTVEAIAGGETPPPELEIARTPRTGTALTHRLVALFSGDPQPPPAWAHTPPLPRAAAEPHVDAWAGRLLGNPARVRCLVQQLAPETGQVVAVQEVSLAELGVAPLDLVYAVEGGRDGQPAEIEQRILYQVVRRAGGLPPGSQLQLDLGRNPGWNASDLGYGEFSELLRSVRALITGTRGLDARDLNPPHLTEDPGFNPAELEARAAQAQDALQRSRTDLDALLGQPEAADLENLRDAVLRSASFGVAGAVPLSPAGSSAADRTVLIGQGRSVCAELTRRETDLANLRESFTAAHGPQVQDAPIEARVDFAAARLRLVFGKAFVVLPRFVAADPDELAHALADSDKVQGGDQFASITWFQRMGRVRDGIGRLNHALSYSQAVGSPERLKLAVAQLPYVENDRWVGLPLDAGKSLPGGKLSLVIQASAPLDAHKPLAGVLVDEWVEVVPNVTETTGIAFQYDQPNAAPPQAILIAVPPDITQPWTPWSLQQVLLETLDLARIRAVDPDALGEVGHFLPAMYFAYNTGGDDTVSTDFTPVK